MVQLTHRSLVTLIGAIIGFISLFLPWVVSSASGFGLTASEGLSPAQLVASLFSSGSSSDPTDPAIAAWEQSAVVGYWLWLLGSVILAVGCLLAAIQVLSGSGSAGVVMLVGSGMGGAGIASFSATFPTSLGVQLSIGPTYGLGIAILASVVTLVSLFIKDTPLHVPVAGASPTAPTSATSRFCPTCGQWYQQDYKVCPRDGSELKPVSSGLMACPRCGASVNVADRFCSQCGFQGMP